MAGEGEAVYCTLLMSDNYLPGAMVLAHSLRDNGTTAKIVVLVTLGTLKSSTIDELKTIYDEVIPINRIVNRTPANLYLMDRPDLISMFSKIELWRQTQYKQIVYIDADVVALRDPDELLSLDTTFAAVPDIGWPDCFNTGLMVLRPNLEDYYALMALAKRGVSFDGADQGLLNMHFGNWKRLSFTYNCTPSGHYQYVPAFRHFESTISLVHYIGQQKPWNLPRYATPRESPYNQLLGRWWATYDRHYRPRPAPLHSAATPLTGGSQPQALPQRGVETTTPTQQQYSVAYPQTDYLHQITHVPSEPVPHLPALDVPTAPHTEPRSEQKDIVVPSEEKHAPEVQHITESPSIAKNVVPVEGRAPPQLGSEVSHADQKPTFSAVPQYVRGEENVSTYRYSHPGSSPGPQQHAVPLSEPRNIPPTQPSQFELTESPAQPETVHHEAPPDQRPAHQEPGQSEVVPERPFSPPKMQWDASRAPPPRDSKPEASSLGTQKYNMSQDTGLFRPPKSYPEAPKDMYYEVPQEQPATEKLARIFPWESYAPRATRVFFNEASQSKPSLPLGTGSPEISREPTPQKQTVPASPKLSFEAWQGYARSNAWDEVPEIERYMQSIQRPRKARVQVLSGGTSASGKEGRRESIKVTDFPSEVERPSLPVTPAPIRRPNFWAGERDESGELPAAEGVPKQEDWNPMERLEVLQRRQSMFLEQQQQASGSLSPARRIPDREMPGDEPFNEQKSEQEERTAGTKKAEPHPTFMEPSFASSRASREQDDLESIDPVNR